jgi:hypothetical protein
VAPEPVRAAPVAAQAPPEPTRSAAARRPGTRVSVPSWSDVLLGVQPPPRDAAAARQRPPSRRRRKG